MTSGAAVRYATAIRVHNRNSSVGRRKGKSTSATAANGTIPPRPCLRAHLPARALACFGFTARCTSPFP